MTTEVVYIEYKHYICIVLFPRGPFITYQPNSFTMAFFIILLTISQIVSFFLIFNKIKPFIKPKSNGIILKLIPDKPTYESLDPSHKLVYDVMRSVKLENWKVEVEADRSYHSKTWQVYFESPTGIRIRSRIREKHGIHQMYLSNFNILNTGTADFSSGGTISIDNESKIRNKLKRAIKIESKT